MTYACCHYFSLLQQVILWQYSQQC